MFMRCDDDGCPRRGRFAKQRIDFITPVRVETGMRFIEQPQRRAANCHHGKGRASLLPRRHARNGRTKKPIVQAHPLRRFFDFVALCSDDIAPEAQIFTRTEIEIQTVRVTEESNARSNSIAFTRDIEAHHMGRTTGDGKKTRAQT